MTLREKIDCMEAFERGDELGMCNENMAEVWSDATKVNELNKELKRKKR